MLNWDININLVMKIAYFFLLIVLRQLPCYLWDVAYFWHQDNNYWNIVRIKLTINDLQSPNYWPLCQNETTPALAIGVWVQIKIRNNLFFLFIYPTLTFGIYKPVWYLKFDLIKAYSIIPDPCLTKNGK